MPQSRRVRFVCISDTHNHTPKLPRGDVLIHAGDLTNQGTLPELRKAVAWLEKADFEAKVVVAGNHDITLDRKFYEEHGVCFHNQRPQDPEQCLELLQESSSISYLNHASTTIRLKASNNGQYTRIKIFGSPYSPAQDLWAFGYNQDEAATLWDGIPLNTDVIITHTPPKHHCDAITEGPGGCENLRQTLWRIRPKLAVCGHRHQGRGVERVRWRLDAPHAQDTPNQQHLAHDHEAHDVEESTEVWIDAGLGNKKQSLVDLTAKGRQPLDNHDDVSGRMGRKETCVVNAAIMATSHGGPKRFNKPIIVDVDLPIQDGGEASPEDG